MQPHVHRMCSPNSLPKKNLNTIKAHKISFAKWNSKNKKRFETKKKELRKKKEKEKGSSKNKKIKCFNYEKVRHMLIVLITKISKRLRKQLGMIVSPIIVSLRTPIRIKMILLCCIWEKSLFKNWKIFKTIL